MNAPLALAYNYAQYTDRHIFLTGKAGTGKTTFLRHLTQATHKRHIVVAPTGVAAINAGGVTIHSFFQLAPGLYLPGQAVQRDPAGGRGRYGFSRHKLNILRSLDLLIIDEISMVRCDLLDAIDEVLRRYQRHDLPFGGVQLLMIGDLQQLSPVARDEEWQLLRQHYRTPYFFDSLALRQTDYTTIELTQVYRQDDPTFIGLLNQVRTGRLDAPALQLLASRYRPDFRPADGEGYITLTTHNRQAQRINDERLAALRTRAVTFSARVAGDFPEVSYPTEAQLTLKVGEQVMFCKNDTSAAREYYNGLIGRVAAIDEAQGTVMVWIDAERREVELGPQEWQNTKYTTHPATGEIREEVAGTFTQIPLRAAWAITIHKSQGLTFDRAVIDAGRAFSYGQVYVALSRCRSLQGLVLSTPIAPDAIMSDPDVVRYNRYVEQNQPTPARLADDRRRYVESLLCQMFDLGTLMRHLSELVRRCGELIGRAHPDFVTRLLAAVPDATDLAEVGQRFQQQIRRMMPLAPDYDANTALHERIRRGTDYFAVHLAEALGELTHEGLPDIGNKAHRERIGNAWQPLKAEYDLKMALLVGCGRGFTLERYWDAKAAATMADDAAAGKKKAAAAGKAKKPTARKAAGRKRKTDA